MIALAFAGLVLVGCGDDGGGGGGGLSESQSDAADQAIQGAAAAGMELDEDCVNEVAGRLSEEDAKRIAAGDQDEISTEGQELSIELINCADQDAITDLFIEGLNQSGQNFDEDCAREKVAELDMAELVAATQGGAPPSEVIVALMECMDLGG